jgi:hypothetical protein
MATSCRMNSWTGVWVYLLPVMGTWWSLRAPEAHDLSGITSYIIPTPNPDERILDILGRRICGSLSAYHAPVLTSVDRDPPSGYTM